MAAVIAIALLGVGYGVLVVRVRSHGLGWPVRRSMAWLAGLLVIVYATSGAPAVWGRVLLWMFTVRLLALFLVAPPLLAYGRPLALCTDAWPTSDAGRRAVGAARSLVRAVGQPLISPVIVPVVLGLIFFTPILTAALRSARIDDALGIGVVVVGLLLSLGVIGENLATWTTLALFAAIGLALGEFLLDAVPGIVVSLHTHLLAGPAWTGLHRAWPPSPHTDQTHAGAIIWGVAEADDLPFLAVLAMRLIRADTLEAARIDTLLDVRAELSQPDPAAPASDDPQDDSLAPWWLTDPTRLRGHLFQRARPDDGSEPPPGTV